MDRGKKEKEKHVLGNGCGSACVQGAPPPTRDLVIECQRYRVSTVSKETNLKDHITTKGVCVFALNLLCRTLMPSIIHLNYKYLKMV